MNTTHLLIGTALIALAGPALALKGHDDSNQCDVELKGNYKLEGLNKTLKEGTMATFFDGARRRP